MRTKRALIIAGFNKIGKSYCKKHYYNSLILDADYRNFKLTRRYVDDNNVFHLKKKYVLNKQYPVNYYNYIVSNLYKADVILIYPEIELLKKLEEHSIEYILVYPEDNRKNIQSYTDMYISINEVDTNIKKDKYLHTILNRINSLDNFIKFHNCKKYIIKDIKKENLFTLLETKFSNLFDKPFKVKMNEEELKKK